MDSATLAETRTLLSKYERERDELSQRVRLIDASISAMKLILDGSMTSGPVVTRKAVTKAKADSKGGKPRARSPIAEHVRTGLGRGAVRSVQEMVERLSEDGVTSSPSTVHRKLQDGVATGEIVYENGAWSLAPSTSVS